MTKNTSNINQYLVTEIDQCYEEDTESWAFKTYEEAHTFIKTRKREDAIGRLMGCFTDPTEEEIAKYLKENDTTCFWLISHADNGNVRVWVEK